MRHLGSKFWTFPENQDNSIFKTILTFDLWWKFAMVENENENLNLTCLNEHKSDFFWIYNKYKNTQILFWNIGCYFPTLGGWNNTKTYYWTLLCKFCIIRIEIRIVLVLRKFQTFNLRCLRSWEIAFCLVAKVLWDTLYWPYFDTTLKVGSTITQPLPTQFLLKSQGSGTNNNNNNN